MLLTVAGALTIATLVVIAAQLARERRALASDIRALRQDLRQLAKTIAPGREAGPADDELARGDDVDPSAPHRDHPAAHVSRGSRTLH